MFQTYMKISKYYYLIFCFVLFGIFFHVNKFNFVLAQEINIYSLKQVTKAEVPSIISFKKQKNGTEQIYQDIKRQGRIIRDRITILENSNPQYLAEIELEKHKLNLLRSRISNLFEAYDLTEKDIIYARPTEQPNAVGDYEIDIRFSNEGSKKFALITKELAGTGLSLGIFFNGELVASPAVARAYADTGIMGGRAAIRNNFTLETAESIALAINEAGLKATGLTPERKAQQLMELAQQQYLTKEFEAALNSYNKAIEIDPTREDIYLNRGKILAILGNELNAVDDYEKFLALEPYRIYDSEPFSYLLEFYLKNRNHKNAVQLWQKRAKFNSSVRNILPFIEAIYAIAFYDYSTAFKKFDIALEMNTENSENMGLEIQNIFIYWYRGLLYDRLDKAELATRDFERVKNFNLESIGFFYWSPLLDFCEKNQKCSVSQMPFIEPVFYLKSLACERLKDSTCAKENRDYIKQLSNLRHYSDLPKMSNDSEIENFFSKKYIAIENILNFDRKGIENLIGL